MFGTRWSMTHGSRADGMFCSDSRSNVVLAAVALVSTIGLSPLTVTVSCTVEMRELLVDLRREADADDDALADDRLESGQLELHRVGADRNLREAEAPGFAARRDLRLNQRGAGQRDGCARQHGAGVVTHPARDFAGLDLRQRRNRTSQ